MQRFTAREDVTLNVETCSLDELAAQIGRAIGRVLATLGEPPGGDAELRVRAWISGLDPRTRGRLLATVLTPAWPAGCEGVAAAIRAEVGRARAQA